MGCGRAARREAARLFGGPELAVVDTARVMSVVLELALELVIELAGEILLELGISGFKRAFDRPSRHPVLASFAYLVMGAAAGGISLLLFSERITGPGSLSGLSLIVGPLVVGASMYIWGSYRRRGGRVTTGLATFHGGAAFAFGVALVRYLGTS